MAVISPCQSPGALNMPAENGKIARITNYTDIDDARAAAERLAEERG